MMLLIPGKEMNVASLAWRARNAMGRGAKKLHSSIYRASDGALVASCAQEGLMRQRPR